MPNGTVEYSLDPAELADQLVLSGRIPEGTGRKVGSVGLGPDMLALQKELTPPRTDAEGTDSDTTDRRRTTPTTSQPWQMP